MGGRCVLCGDQAPSGLCGDCRHNHVSGYVDGSALRDTPLPPDQELEEIRAVARQFAHYREGQPLAIVVHRQLVLTGLELGSLRSEAESAFADRLRLQMALDEVHETCRQKSRRLEQLERELAEFRRRDESPGNHSP
jgi:hypothetical protein